MQKKHYLFALLIALVTAGCSSLLYGGCSSEESQMQKAAAQIREDTTMESTAALFRDYSVAFRGFERRDSIAEIRYINFLRQGVTLTGCERVVFVPRNRGLFTKSESCALWFSTNHTVVAYLYTEESKDTRYLERHR